MAALAQAGTAANAIGAEMKPASDAPVMGAPHHHDVASLQLLVKSRVAPCQPAQTQGDKQQDQAKGQVMFSPGQPCTGAGGEFRGWWHSCSVGLLW